MFFVFQLFFMVSGLVSFLLLNYIFFSGWSFLFYFSIFSGSSVEVSFPILIDWMGMSVVFLVNVITYCVFGFSKCYLDKEEKKLLLLISMFVVGMWLVCLVPSLVGIMVGWDILGMVSYKLILHYPSDKSVSASNFTVFANRVGDAALVLAVGLSLSTSNCFWIFSNKSFLIMFLLILAALTKSAGYPFMAWLPEAMAAPTPVSALVHSSTLVTAGILLLSRFNLWIEGLDYLLFYVGLYVCWLSGFCAMFEMDIKKVVALSTLSQLGVMMLALGLKSPVFAFFHLCTHACFKSLLFITVGVIIKYNGHFQDLRHFSMCLKNHVFTSSAMIISLVALVGFPFLAGFYSKDLVYDKMISLNFGIFSYMSLCFSFGLTSGYSLKMFKIILMKGFFSSVESKSMYEPKKEMMLLGTMSGLFGFLYFSVMSMDVLENKVNFFLKLISVFLWLGGVILVSVIKMKKISSFFSSLGFLAFVSKQMPMANWVLMNKKILKSVDHGLVEKVLGQGQKNNVKSSVAYLMSWNSEEWAKGFFFLTRVWFYLAILMYAVNFL